MHNLAFRLDVVERSVILECLGKHVCADADREAVRFELENFFREYVPPRSEANAD